MTVVVAKLYLKLRNWDKAMGLLAEAREDGAGDKVAVEIAEAGLCEARMYRVNADAADEQLAVDHRMCRVCGKLGTKTGEGDTLKILVCGRCCLAHYCSVACQLADWLRHKAACHAIDVKTCCKWCWVEGTKGQCGRCRAVKYCSATCQKLHWTKGHKEECGK